jgi:hypothetical protein
MISGNTDCKMYYNLSKHIYRFMGGPSKGGSGVVRSTYGVERQKSLMGSIPSMSDLASPGIIRLFDGFTLLSRIPMPILVRSELYEIADSHKKALGK